MKRIYLIVILLFFTCQTFASSILIPMDDTQKNHLKAYGITYWVLGKDIQADWLLNYRGGSFLLPNIIDIQQECKIRGVSFEIIADNQVTNILQEISLEETNADIVRLEKIPKIAVYTPNNKLPWDDAVTLVLTYAEIPYETVYDQEILSDNLLKYDWLHLHHEDFTGQYGKFYASYKLMTWYQEDVANQEKVAQGLGFHKVSQMKLAVAKKIRDFTAGGGFLFAMCSGTDSFDIALSAEGIDICDIMFDGDTFNPNANALIDFNKTFAFKDFTIDLNPYNYEYSDIDVPSQRLVSENQDFFTLFDFSAKWDVIPTILTQNHSKVIKGFMGQTTAYKNQFIKSEVLVLGENAAFNEAKYIHGSFGNGTWTFYGGHDPEDYRHLVGDPKTDLNLYPNSPGYRLILNNILFPAAKKKNQKT